MNLKFFLKPLITFFLMNLTSCITIDTTEFSCGKFSNSSSVSLSDLLKSPEFVTINEKSFKLFVTINYLDKDGIISKFPSQFLPKFKSSCAEGSSGYMYTLKDNKYLEALDSYKIERIWYINSKKEVWETSNLTLDNYLGDPLIKKMFIVKESLPNFRSNYISDIIVKFTYNDKSHFIKQRYSIYNY